MIWSHAPVDVICSRVPSIPCHHQCSFGTVQFIRMFWCRSYGIVSYYVQQLFSRYQGVRYANTLVHSSDPQELTAASATCDDDACTKIAVKVWRLP